MSGGVEWRSSGMSRQAGYVLATSLIFLLVITMVAVVGMQSTSMEYSISTNTALATRAFEAAEGGRAAADQVLDRHIFERGWGDEVDLPPTVTVLDKDGDNASDVLFTDNSEGADALLNESALETDITFRVDADGDGKYTGDEDAKADIMVYKTGVVAATGAATAMVSGYEGLGKASAAGGAHIYFEIRSRGEAPGGAKAITANTFRVVVRN